MQPSAALPPGPWIVKLGGSLHDAPELGLWLSALATLPGPPRIVVPGGGPFADAVRAAQPVLGFDELAAHRMAILAMQQLGLALQSREPRLGLVESVAELRRVEDGAGAVWLPWRLAGRESGIEASWDVTSDSIALWLARRLGAPVLALVKSARLEPWPAGIGEAAGRGIIDPAFPRLAAGFRGSIHLLSRAEPEALAALPERGVLA